MGPTNQLHHDLQSEDARPDWMDATGVLNKFWPRETDFSLLKDLQNGGKIQACHLRDRRVGA